MRTFKTIVLSWLCALSVEAQSRKPSTNLACATRYGLVSKAIVPTVTDTFIFTSTLTRKATVTPTTTMTPETVTNTVSTTSTSVSVVDTQTTDTYTTTQYSTSTVPTLTVETYSATAFTSTTVTISSTTTIATAAGFTPVASILGYAAKDKRNAVLEKREAMEARSQKALALPVLGGAQAKAAVAAPSQYAKKVICAKDVTSYVTKTVTKTAALIVTQTATAPTSIVTYSTSTTVLTTSTLADATSIITVPITVMTTSTSTSSTTTTSTSTITIDAPSATWYAQCDASNMISSAQGQKIGFIRYNPAFTLASQQMSDPTGYGCCAVCAATENCAGYGQNPNGYCYYILTDGRCSGAQSYSDEYHYYNLNGDGYVVGDGQCGFLKSVAGTR